MKKERKPIIQKIEFDEKTKEPIKIQLQGDEFAEQIVVEPPEVTDEHDFINNTSAKQMMMTQVMGIETNTNVNKRQKIFKNLFALLFGIIVIAVLVFTAINDFTGGSLPSWSEVGSIFAENWYWAIFAVLAVALYYIIKGLKLSINCKSVSGKFHFKTCMETAVVGLYYNNVTPLAVGGQPFEIYHLSKHGVHGGVASSIPITTYFFNQIAFVMISIVSIILFGTNKLHIPESMMGFAHVGIKTTAIVGIILCAIVPILVVFFSLLPRFTSKLVAGVLFIGNKLRLVKNPKATAMKTYKTVIHNARCIKKLATKPLVFSSLFLLSFLEHISFSSLPFFIMNFFGFETTNGILGWLQIVQITLILYCAISFIPTPGNAGAADLSFYALFSAGLLPGFAFPAMLSWRVLSFYSTIIIGFIFINVKKRADKKLNKSLTE